MATRQLSHDATWWYFKVIQLFHTKFLKNGVWYGKSYYRQLIGNHTLAFVWCHFWWPWSTFEGHFSRGCHFHVHFRYPWHAFSSHGLPSIAELLVFACDTPGLRGRSTEWSVMLTVVWSIATARSTHNGLSTINAGVTGAAHYLGGIFIDHQRCSCFCRSTCDVISTPSHIGVGGQGGGHVPSQNSGKNIFRAIIM